ncbi:hypothetical protein [Pseudomonas nicosulfuronedens]
MAQRAAIARDLYGRPQMLLGGTPSRRHREFPVSLPRPGHLRLHST